MNFSDVTGSELTDSNHAAHVEVQAKVELRIALEVDVELHVDVDLEQSPYEGTPSTTKMRHPSSCKTPQLQLRHI